MGNTLLDKMYDAKTEYEPAYYSFFSDGTVDEKSNYLKDAIDKANDDKELSSLSHYLERLARDHSIQGKYDSLDVNISFGIIFNAEDVIDNKPKGPGHAIRNIVDVRIDGSSSYLERNLVNENIDTIYYGKVGYMSLDSLISYLEEQGLSYNGPDNYDQVLYDYIYERPMTATITANLSKKRSKTLVRK